MKHHITVIDNKTGKTSHYSTSEWNISWWLVWAFGFMVGVLTELILLKIANNV